MDLKGSKGDLINLFEKLENENWIDRYTRAVLVEFTVYNAQVSNLFLETYFSVTTYDFKGVICVYVCYSVFTSLDIGP